MRVLGLLLWAPLAARGADDYQHRAEQVLMRTPLIDGHNDLPWEIRDRFKSDLTAVDFKADTAKLPLRDEQFPLTAVPWWVGEGQNLVVTRQFLVTRVNGPKSVAERSGGAAVFR